MYAKCGRGVFRRYSGRYVVINILHEPDLRGALPDETWNVLCIDRQRNILLPRYDALGVHGRQGPGLTGEEMGAEKVVIHGQVQMARTQIVGIALVEIGGLRGAEEVHLVTGANFRAEGESESEKCDSSYE